MDAHEKSRKLHEEADEILHQRGVDAILRKYGKVHYTGSYALDLMAWPDIDITMRLHGDPYDFKQFFEIPFARHNDGLPPNYYAALSEFLDRVDEAAQVPAMLRPAKRQLVS